MIVLSLFDGISCGRAALERLGVKVDKYYASEVDPYAEKVSRDNWPDIIRLGDITKWREWDIETPDIIMGGSPCQGFSFAGKQLNFEDPRSKLFFVFADIVKHYHPKYFLLENVKMRKEYQDVISNILGDIYPEHTGDSVLFGAWKLEPVALNSALVSAQNRPRIYWTNWKINPPEDRGIMLNDILESGASDRDKSYAIDAGYAKTSGVGCGLATYLDRGKRQLVMEERKMFPYTKGSSASLCIQVGVADLNINESCKRVYSPEGKAPTLTAICGGNQEPKVAVPGPLLVREATKKGYVEIQPGECVDLTFPESKTRRGRRMEDKCNCLTASPYDYGKWDGFTWRKLTVTECCRLQTLPDDYCRAVSNSRAYHALGNGWTVEMITHILGGIL